MATDILLAWIPAEPGRREPSANVPISILDLLNREADLHARGADLSRRRPDTDSPHESDGNTHSPASFNEDKQVQCESQSDDPLSASEWPPSPGDLELPPDSSMESPVSKPMVLSESRRSSQVTNHSKTAASRRSSDQQEIPSTDSGAISSVAKISDSVVDPMEEPDEDNEKETSSYVREITSIIEMSGSEILSHSPSIQGSTNDVGGSHVKKSSHLNSPALHGSDMYNDEHGDVSGDVNPITKPKSSPWQSFDVGSHRVKRRRLSGEIYDLPSSPVSDLEMTVPLALDDKAVIRGVPCTAPQPSEPFAQVKRTPYVVDQRDERSISKKRRESLESSGESHQILPNGASSEEVDHVTQSIPSVTEGSSAEAAAIRSQMELAQGQSPQVAGLNDNVDIAAWSPINSGKIRQDINLSNIQSKHASPSPKTMSPNGWVPEGQAHDVLIESSSGDDAIPKESEQKRKASDLQPLSPNVSKRRKRFKEPVAFRSAGDNGDGPDSAEGARRFRQGFIASRRTSKSSSPVGSSTSQPVINGSPSVHMGDYDGNILDADAHSPNLPESSQRVAAEIRTYSPGTGDGLPMDHDSPDSGPRPSDKSYEMNIFESRPVVDDGLNQEVESNEALPGAQADAADADIDQSLRRTDEIIESQMTDSGWSLYSDTCCDEASSQLAQKNQPDHINTDLAPQSNLLHKGEKPGQLGPSSPKADLSGPSSPTMSIRNASKNQAPADVTQLEPGQLQSLNAQATVTENDMASSHMDHSPSSGAASPKLPVMAAVVEKTENTRFTGGSKSDTRNASPISIFEKFKVAYPVYSGDQKHFTAMCKKISSLLIENRMLHQAVWDDFIVRHKAEYSHYVQRCTEDVEDPRRYEDFYRNEIDQLLYQKRVVTLKTLDEALKLANKRDIEPRPIKPKVSLEQGEPSTTSAKPAKSVDKDRNLKPRVMIDLTEAEGQSEVPNSPLKKPAKKEAFVRHKKIRRSLPWVDDNTILNQESRQRSNLLLSDKNRQNPPPQTSATQATRQENGPDAWWKDENAPFRAFVNSYNAIRPGNGNSYAKEEPGGIRKPKWRKVDILKWEL